MPQHYLAADGTTTYADGRQSAGGGQPTTLAPDPLRVLEARAKDLPGYAYKLDTGGYAMDFVIGDHDLPVDESRMSAWILFADGKRRDGVGDLLEVGGIRTERHQLNPVILFNHGKGNHMWSEWPIAQATDPRTGEYTVDLDPVTRTAKVNAFFYQGKDGIPGVDGDASKAFAVYCEQIYDLWCKKFIRGGSIGYQVVHARELPPDYELGLPKGLHLLSVLMLEASPVIMPCNMDTVRKAYGDWRPSYEHVREILAMPRICGRPTSPYLVKSLAPYAPARKAQLGYEGKSGAGGGTEDRLAKIGAASQNEENIGYGNVFWHPDKKEVWYVVGDWAEKKYDDDPVVAELSAVPGVEKVTREAESFPPRDAGWVECYPRRRPHVSKGEKNLPPLNRGHVKSLRAKYKAKVDPHHKDGYRARLASKPRESNPHADDEVKRRSWDEGWARADSDLRKPGADAKTLSALNNLAGGALVGAKKPTQSLADGEKAGGAIRDVKKPGKYGRHPGDNTFFRTCTRDKQGRCLPQGRGDDRRGRASGGAARDGDDKPAGRGGDGKKPKPGAGRTTRGVRVVRDVTHGDFSVSRGEMVTLLGTGDGETITVRKRGGQTGKLDRGDVGLRTKKGKKALKANEPPKRNTPKINTADVSSYAETGRAEQTPAPASRAPKVNAADVASYAQTGQAAQAAPKRPSAQIHPDDVASHAQAAQAPSQRRSAQISPRDAASYAQYGRSEGSLRAARKLIKVPRGNYPVAKPAPGTEPPLGYEKPKSLAEARRKYRSLKNLRRRLRRSKATPGRSVILVSGKDMKAAAELAATRGVKFQWLDTHASGHERVKLIGDDGAMDEVAKEFGRRYAPRRRLHKNLGDSLMGVKVIKGGQKAITENPNQDLQSAELADTQDAENLDNDVTDVGDDLDDAADLDDVGGPTDEKYGAQVMRKLHADAQQFLQDYDEMMGPLEHPPTAKLLTSKLQRLVDDLEEFEDHFAKHYPDLEPLGGGLDAGIADEDADVADEDAVEADVAADDADAAAADAAGDETGSDELGDAEITQGDMDTMDDAAVGADSTPVDEPTPEEALEGMEDDEGVDDTNEKSLEGMEDDEGVDDTNEKSLRRRYVKLLREHYGKGLPSDNISPGKARQMLHDGGYHDRAGTWHALTDAQRGMLGAAANRGKKALKTGRKTNEPPKPAPAGAPTPKPPTQRRSAQIHPADAVSYTQRGSAAQAPKKGLKCPKCGVAGRKCGKKSVEPGAETVDVPHGNLSETNIPPASWVPGAGAKGSLAAHERTPVKEAGGYLGDIAKAHEFTDASRMDAYHHYRTLDGISQLQDVSAALNDQTGGPTNQGDGQPDGTAGGAANPDAKAIPGEDAPPDESQIAGDLNWLKEEGEETGHGDDVHPHRRSVKEAALFLRDLSQHREPMLSDEQRMKSNHFHKVLGEIAKDGEEVTEEGAPDADAGTDDATDVGTDDLGGRYEPDIMFDPGEMGEKQLEAIRQQEKEIEELAGITKQLRALIGAR